MKVEALSLPGILKVTPARFGDHRGFFSETYNQKAMAEAGIPEVFVQDNQSLSRQKGVVRGLHCQLEPYGQGKLVRVTRGAIWDVAVDARTGSPTYGQWVGAELSAENWAQLWLPVGFLHGFVTLEENTEVQYKCTGFYDKASERSVRWDCEQIGIEWPVERGAAVLSEKDEQAPAFEAAKGWFSYK
ncbi:MULTISPECIES: dTDP-4-dehydrorhamnose 3,5-epimerase [Bombella]|uniref:dTDP-4-dehydrorhamnose 3,5-epimerase n=1 Tax=Bombella saccharophila TaxID=2967338 RepID=A0ABT3W7E1_9PROT|nr:MULTISPECIES: dTDP-4-dehydrorhamnose 3,5-epimerase [Bombella]MCT6837642.1 dTDP-4-dehydrorhamnose 3,5-epimerase [Bifidobacteriales bacterium]PHI96783.1 dTDP-4-dehydrorhamnose 3,5-epimerase [Parasaccharibacter apium]MCX5614583.1 dTDP-4-dehydrorhamnose 3,5-epimerase [Bombella saccharophila]MUG05430.1 dTDP-4-dehydrorhamnose 3,5-epimerase [Bombella sp. ESL0378]MUG89410.1 dTDP-4-dehydrorhamnose 3,5-epimerase [Bombella sp. ESL0385]